MGGYQVLEHLRRLWVNSEILQSTFFLDFADESGHPEMPLDLPFLDSLASLRPGVYF